jgi:hypothetical protein
VVPSSRGVVISLRRPVAGKGVSGGRLPGLR